MTKIIKEFHELRCPLSDNGGGANDFCVCDKDEQGLYYLLNNSYMLGDLLDNLKQEDFYFETLVECHDHAAMYYANHAKLYPYENEWREARNDAVVVIGAVTNDNSESQIMEFI